MDWDERKKLFDELRNLVLKTGFKLIHAQQEPRPPGIHLTPPETPSVIIFDHLSLLR